MDTIFVEDGAAEYPVSRRIFAALPKAQVVSIHHYKDVFDRNQDGRKPALILAVKKDSFLYDGSQNCQAFGAPMAYYALPAMGCPFDCQYCFLKGMYPTANILVFVNIDECLTEIRKLAENGPAQVSLSYETDLIAIDHLTGFVSKFAALAPEVPDLTLEIRTKAANLPLVEWASNLVFSFTLSPQEIIGRFEKKTSSLSARLSAVKAAQDAGFAVRLCFDPMILTPGWRKMYTEFFDRIRSEVDFLRVRDVSVGSFRIPKDYLKNMRKNYGETEISLFPYTLEKGTYTYGEAENELLQVALDGLLPVFPREKIYLD